MFKEHSMFYSLHYLFVLYICVAFYCTIRLMFFCFQFKYKDLRMRKEKLKKLSSNCSFSFCGFFHVFYFKRNRLSCCCYCCCSLFIILQMKRQDKKFEYVSKSPSSILLSILCFSLLYASSIAQR